MTFYPSKPAPGDFLNVSVNDIQGNFNVSNTVMGSDHYPFDDTTQGGKHKKSDYVSSLYTLLLPPPTSSGHVVQYAASTPQGTVLAFIADGSIQGIALTTAGVTPKKATNGYTFLPGGFIMQWGKVQKTADPTPVLFVTDNIDFPNGCLNVQLTLNFAPSSGTPQVAALNLSTTGFDLRTTSSVVINSSIYWVAIGF